MDVFYVKSEKDVGINTMYNEERMERAKEYIHKNIDRSISIERLSEELNISFFHFRRIFKNSEGESVHQYIMRCRMELAVHYLVNSRRTIKQIAAFCGYRSVSAFVKAFKKYYESTPTEYRKMH